MRWQAEALSLERLELRLERGRSNGNVSFEVNGDTLTVPTARGVNLAVINLAAWLPRA